MVSGKEGVEGLEGGRGGEEEQRAVCAGGEGQPARVSVVGGEATAEFNSRLHVAASLPVP